MVFRIEDYAPEVTVTLTFQGPVDRTFTDTVPTNRDVRWEVPEPLPAGQYSVTLSAVDKAGNSSLVAATRSMIINARQGARSSGKVSEELAVDGYGTANGSGYSTGNNTDYYSTGDSTDRSIDGGGDGSGADYTVYVTDSGDKYHADGCQYLAHSKYPMQLSEAQADGYTACSVCNP